MIKSIKYAVLGVSLFLLTVCSCSKDNNESIDCLTVLPPLMFNFKIVDAQGNDLFFGEDPEYIIDDFKIIQKVAGEGLDLPFKVNDEDPKFFEIAVSPREKDTCYLIMSANDVDTLVYFGSGKTTQRCPEFQLDSIIFNNEKIEIDTETGIYYFNK